MAFDAAQLFQRFGGADVVDREEMKRRKLKELLARTHAPTEILDSPRIEPLSVVAPQPILPVPSPINRESMPAALNPGEGFVPKKPFLAQPVLPVPPNPMGESVDPSVNVGTLRYQPGHDPQKTQRENLRDEIKDIGGRKFNEKRGVLNTLKGAGLGFLRAFAQSDPRAPFSQRLLSAVGGAGGGAIAGTVDPNQWAKARNQQKLSELYGMYGQQAQIDEADAKTLKMQADVEKARADAQGVGIKNINERSGDYLKTAMADNNIDKEEAATLRTLTGLPYSPNDWRKVIRINEQGVPFITREGEEAARIDQTLPINPAEVNRKRVLEGQEYTVPDKSAFGVAGSVAVGNATRQQSASQFQTTQAAKDADQIFSDEKSYQDAKTAYGQRVRNAKAEYTKAKSLSASLETQIDQAAAEKSANAGYDTTEIDKRLSDLQGRRAAADAEMAASQIKMNEPAPKKLVRPKNPATSQGGKNNNIGSSDDYRKALQRVRGR